jgi:hypothetical protein
MNRYSKVWKKIQNKIFWINSAREKIVTKEMENCVENFIYNKQYIIALNTEVK